MKKAIIQAISLLGMIIPGIIFLALVALGIYIFIEDGIPRLAGRPETGWGVMLWLAFAYPLAVITWKLTKFSYKTYKNNLSSSTAKK